MKRLSALSVAACLLLGALAAYGQAEKQKPRAARPAATTHTTLAAAPAAKPNELSAFMQLKLEHSQKVLEGIVLEDFGMIAKHAQQLALLTQEENWQVLQTREYRRHSDDFARIAERLKEAAQEKNVDGAALDYVQLTLNCVECHKHVRDQRGE